MRISLPRRPIAAGIETSFPVLPKTSSAADMIKAFEPIDKLIADLYAGEVSYVGPTPVMYDHLGDYSEIVPCIIGWTNCLERIARRIDIPLDLGMMRRVAKRLEAGILLDVSDLDRVAALIERCRAIYLACPVHIRLSSILDEQIDIAMDEYGLRRAA